MSTNRKLLLFALLVAAGLAGAATASDSRIAAMGGNPMVVRDYWNIWLFPSELKEHGSLAVAGWGGTVESATLAEEGSATPISSGNYGGTFFGVSKNHGFGLFIEGREEFIEFAPEGADQKTDLFWGGRFGNWKAGIHYGRASSLDEEADAKTGDILHEQGNVSRNTIDIGAASVARGVPVECAITVSHTAFEITNDEAELREESDGYDLIAGRIRAMVAWENEVDFLPYAEVLRDKRGKITHLSGEVSEVDSREITRARAGMGVNFRPISGLLLVGGVGFSHQKDKTSRELRSSELEIVSETKKRSFPEISMGLEYDLSDWLVFRAGAAKRNTRETDGGTSTESAFAYNVGAGVEVRKLQFDVVFDTDYAKRGPYILSGKEGDMFLMVTGTLPY